MQWVQFDAVVEQFAGYRARIGAFMSAIIARMLARFGRAIRADIEL